MTLAIPPYDAIIWSVLFIALTAGVSCCCVCCLWQTIVTREAYVPPAAGVTTIKTQDASGEAADGSSTAEGGSDDYDRYVKESTEANRRLPLRVLLLILPSALLSYLLTCAVFGILGANDFVSAAFFSPISSTDCQDSCTIRSADGLYGWTDETCCSYKMGKRRIPTIQDVFLLSPDGVRIHGWLMVNNTAAHSGQRRLNILYSHGSGGNVAMAYRIVRYQWLLSLGNVRMFVYDYAGYGRSGGSVNGQTIAESATAAAIWFDKFLDDPKRPNYGSSASPVPISADRMFRNTGKVVVMGRSMGGSVAMLLNHQANFSYRAEVLQSTYSSLPDVLRAYFPVCGWVLAAQVADTFDSLNTVEHTHGFPSDKCLYQYHSTSDDWVPIALARKVFAAANSKASCSVFLQVDGAIHTQPMLPLEQSTLASWFERAREDFTSVI